MLRSAPKGQVEQAAPVAREEDSILRAAFGRYGGLLEDRQAAVPIVRRYEQSGAGRWFLCDCRPGVERPPVLVPVAQTHIRRLQDERWPVHSDACDFYRAPAEQEEVTGSYSSAAAARPLTLARPMTAGSWKMESAMVARSYHRSRPGIARLLVRLVTDAGLQMIGADWHPPSLVDQVKAIWAASRPIEIDDGVRLPDFLCTSAKKMRDLCDRVAAAPSSRFTRTRPHGVMIIRAAAIRAGAIEPVAGDPVPVRGRLAVFGERPGDRDTPADRAARAPYLVACVLSRPSPAEPVEVMSAYAHPCVSDDHLMLVDSNLERQTLAQLFTLRRWLGSQRRTRLSIEKPLMDLFPEAPPGTPPHPPCIPDFVVRADGAGGRTNGAVIVETMGFADENYRERKRRIHPLLSAVLGGAPIITHDFHEPQGRTQSWRDNNFWRTLRWTITGPEKP